jgi:hypothetical protein
MSNADNDLVSNLHEAAERAKSSHVTDLDAMVAVLAWYDTPDFASWYAKSGFDVEPLRALALVLRYRMTGRFK